VGEEDDDYPHVVAHLDGKARVIECKNGIQWIIQHRQGRSNSWRGRGFYRTRAVLIRDSRYVSDAAASLLAALPERYQPRSRQKDQTR
jgi:hypothetical protein